MKIKKHTVDVLKNFCNINPSMLFKEGNIVSVMSSESTILARAEVPDEFPMEFGIYDLPKFLATISLFSNAELVFGPDFLTIKGEGRVKYGYADSNTYVAAPYKPVNVAAIPIEFPLTEEDLKMALKAAAVLQLSEVTFKGVDRTISIQANHPTDKSANHFEKSIFDTSEDVDFELNLKIESLKFISTKYNVKVFGSQVVQFSGMFNELPVDYWIAPQTR